MENKSSERIKKELTMMLLYLSRFKDRDISHWMEEKSLMHCYQQLMRSLPIE